MYTEITSPNIKLQATKKIPLFKSFTNSEREKLISSLILREYEKGSAILLSSESNRDIMFIADGTVDVKLVAPNGREVIVARLNTGEFFGEIALLTGSSRTADVNAVEDTMILILRASDFESLLNNIPGLSHSLLVHLAYRVAAASNRIADLALYDVYYRVYRTLKSLAKKDPKSNALIVNERPTHKELASMVGTSREMVTRALTKLQEDGVILLDDKQVTILSGVSYE
jgi:CRP/FNR family cyclic AMP-dependent transcriptional regulator